MAASAALCAYHAHKKPEELTRILGVQPTRVNTPRRFDPVKNGWFFESDDSSEDGRVDKLLPNLLEFVRSVESQIAVAANVGWEFRIMCFASGPPPQPFGLVPTEMALLARLNITISLLCL